VEIRRVALIYDDLRRPETTGVYCRRAFNVDAERFQEAEGCLRQSIEKSAPGDLQLRKACSLHCACPLRAIKLPRRQTVFQKTLQV
jgi:hypothetical protein